MDISHMANKMAAKWIYRLLNALTSGPLSSKYILRSSSLRTLRLCLGFDYFEIFLSKRKFVYKGLGLVKTMWAA